MARPLRLEFPDALWHITNRGVERRVIYADEQDRTCFMALLERAIHTYGWQLRAYVLMSNHYHLLLQTPEPNLSRGMKDLDGDFARAFNTRHERVGHLFGGRFKSQLVDSDGYLLEVSRYIVLNPVRAGLVESPDAWPWSSYRATAGIVQTLSWLDPSPVLERLHPVETEAHAAYREFVVAAITQCGSPWDGLVAQTFLGGPDFIRMVEERVRSQERSREHPRGQRQIRARSLDNVVSAVALAAAAAPFPATPVLARAAVIVLANRQTSATNAAIGRCLGISGQRVGQVFRASMRRMPRDPQLTGLITDAEARLMAN